MQELIKITTNDKGTKVVSAKELYDFLGMNKAVFARWAKKNIEDNKFSFENQDWKGFNMMLNGNDTKDYALTLDFAKRLAMMARTEKGEQARQYFIDCEKKLIELTKPKELSRKEILLLALEAEERAEKAEKTVAILMHTLTDILYVKLSLLKYFIYICINKIHIKHEKNRYLQSRVYC